MDRGLKIRIVLGLIGIGMIIGGWANKSLAFPNDSTIGRVYFVTAIFCVLFFISLWEMFKPKGLNFPGYASRGYIVEPIHPYDLLYKEKRTRAVLRKRIVDLQKTYEHDPDTLASELIGLKEDILSCLKNKSITTSHYEMLNEMIDKIMEDIKQ